MNINLQLFPHIISSVLWNHNVLRFCYLNYGIDSLGAMRYIQEKYVCCEIYKFCEVYNFGLMSQM